MSETRKLAAILVSDVVGYSRLTGADEDRILARLRALRLPCITGRKLQRGDQLAGGGRTRVTERVLTASLG